MTSVSYYESEIHIIFLSLLTDEQRMRLHPEMAHPVNKMLFMTPRVEKQVSTETHTSVPVSEKIRSFFCTSKLSSTFLETHI